MLNKNKMYCIMAGLFFFLALTPNLALAQQPEVEMGISPRETSKFSKIEQPLSLKLTVALGGLGLIGIELWWFVFSKTKSSKAQIKK